MTGYINVVCESLILSVGMVFFLVEGCEDKKKGFAALFFVEFVNNYVLFRILWMTEAGIALQQVMVWRIVWYIVYITFRLGWFRVFVKESYREFLLNYLYLWIGTYTTVGVAFTGIHFIFPEKLAIDAMSTMPRTYVGLGVHLLVSPLPIVGAVWLKKRNWIQKLSTNFLCILFAFVFVLADVGTTFLLVKEYMKSITYTQITLINLAFLLAASYFGYVNYLKTSARKENERINRIIKRQFHGYEILSKKENEIRRIRHDLANHLQVIREAAGSEKEAFSRQYRDKLNQLYEDISRNYKQEPFEENDVKRKSKAVSWGIFTIFVVDVLMVIIMSQLVLDKVFTYENIIIMQFALILFIILHTWMNFRRTKRENEELSRKIDDSMEQPDITRLMGYLEEIADRLEFISPQEEENVLRQLDSTEFAVVTGNHIWDTMLWHKKSICRESGIELEIEWNLSEDIGIDDMDMIGLIGNLLDNAIEACNRVGHGESLIQVKGKKQANIVSIRVRNTKNESEEPIKHKFKTMKKDAENHGIGMKIIRSIVNKYDGTIQYYDEKTEFTVIVNLQV